MIQRFDLQEFCSSVEQRLPINEHTILLISSNNVDLAIPCIEF